MWFYWNKLETRWNPNRSHSPFSPDHLALQAGQITVKRPWGPEQSTVAAAACASEYVISVVFECFWFWGCDLLCCYKLFVWYHLKFFLTKLQASCLATACRRPGTQCHRPIWVLPQWCPQGSTAHAPHGMFFMLLGRWVSLVSQICLVKRPTSKQSEQKTIVAFSFSLKTFWGYREPG